MPTYNKADTVRRTLQSLIEQSRPPDELIIIDDASTDETPFLAIMTHPSIRSIRNSTNLGVTRSRNIGARAAGGDYLAFVDSDDVVGREWAATLMSLAEKGAAIASCGGRIMNEVTGEIEIRHPRHYREGLFRPFCWLFLPGSFVVARELFLGCGGYEEGIRALESPELAARLAACCRRNGLQIMSVDDVLLEWGKNPQRALGRVEESWRGALYLLETHGVEMSSGERARLRFAAGRDGVLAGKGRATVWYAWRGALERPTKGRLLHAALMTVSPRVYVRWWIRQSGALPTFQD